jgi:hypothetical protein
MSKLKKKRNRRTAKMRRMQRRTENIGENTKAEENTLDTNFTD